MKRLITTVALLAAMGTTPTLAASRKAADTPLPAPVAAAPAKQDPMDQLKAQMKEQRDNLKAQQKDERDKLKAQQKEQRDKLHADQREQWRKYRQQADADGSAAASSRDKPQTTAVKR